MGLGQGSIAINQRREAAGAPATVTGASNGLSLSGTDVVLGGILTGLTTIDTANLQLIMGHLGAGIIIKSGNETVLGDFNANVNGTRFTVNDGVEMIIGRGGATLMEGIVLDFANSVFSLGDTTSTANGTLLNIDDTNQLITCESGGVKGLELDFINNLYYFGNYDVKSGIYLDDAGSSNYMDIYCAQTGAGETDIYMDAADGSIYIQSDNPAVGSSSSIYMNQIGSPNTIFLNGSGGIQTSQPNGAASMGRWLLGKTIAAAVVFDAANYVEVKIDGVLRKLALVV